MMVAGKRFLLGRQADMLLVQKAQENILEIYVAILETVGTACSYPFLGSIPPQPWLEVKPSGSC
jgi:hypothetical protein